MREAFDERRGIRREVIIFTVLNEIICKWYSNIKANEGRIIGTRVAFDVRFSQGKAQERMVR